MPLTDHEKNELAQQLQLLAGMNEPEALVASLQRAAERKALDRIITTDEARRWRIVASVLNEAEQSVNAAQSPEAHKLATHMDEWTGDAGQGQPGQGQLRPGNAKAQPTDS